MSNKRIKYIDMLKAFCIILVIAGHMRYTPAKVKLLLYVFIYLYSSFYLE